jgi:hypothetical protein
VRAIRLLLQGIAVLAVWMGLGRIIWHVPFTPGMTEALVRAASWLDIHGVEDVEDLYLDVMTVLSLALALLIVAAGSRMLGRAGQRNSMTSPSSKKR